MSNPPPNLPQADDFLPDWSAKRFVVLDPSGRWAPAISLELKHNHGAIVNGVSLETCQTTREALLMCESSNSVGLILFIDGLERDCLGLLRRLCREPNQLAVLAIGKSRHTELMPVIMEAGATGFLIDVENDIPVANWCRNLLSRFLTPH